MKRGFKIRMYKFILRVRWNRAEVHSKIAINIRFGGKVFSESNNWMMTAAAATVMVHFDNGVAINIPRQYCGYRLKFHFRYTMCRRLVEQCTNTIHIHSCMKQTNQQRTKKNQSIVCEIVIILSKWDGWYSFFARLLVLQKQSFVYCSDDFTAHMPGCANMFCIMFDWMCFSRASMTHSNNYNDNEKKIASPWICQARLEWICKFPTMHSRIKKGRSRKCITRETFYLLPSFQDLSDFLLNIQQNERLNWTNKKNCVYSFNFSNCHSLGNP